MNVTRYLMDLLLPRSCAVCGDRLSTQALGICPHCINSLPTYINSFDIALSTEFSSEEPTVHNPQMQSGTIERLEGDAYIEELFALFSFSPNNAVQRIIHALKYEGDREVGLLLGRIAARQLDRHPHTYDLLIPVPLSRDRLAMRGFNQATIIAHSISKTSGIPTNDKAIIRRGTVQSQTARSKDARQQAVRGSFECIQPETIRGKRILLIDDVLTTGATLTEVASVLQKAGAASITAFVAAVSVS